MLLMYSLDALSSRSRPRALHPQASARNTIVGARRKWLIDGLLSILGSDGPVGRGSESNVLGGSSKHVR
jgi:hypothetical protein